MIYKISSQKLRDDALIDLPASKSLSNRALIIRGLCGEPCEISHLSDCDDTKVMLAAFDFVDKNYSAVDIGAAGTSMRFLTAYFASKEGAQVVMTGSERMKQRPISVLVDALRKLGAEIEYVENEGFPPLRISGRKLRGGRLEIDGSISSQYISALLMIAPTLTCGLDLHLLGDITSVPYINMTLAMMREFGVAGSFEKNVISVKPQQYRAIPYAVESDWSAASYWYEILALSSEINSIRLKGLRCDSTQGDCRIANYFEELGIKTEACEEGVRISRTNTPLPEKVEWNMASQPDLAQTVICTCCALGVSFDITGLHTLRIKETDRIAALEAELLKLGFVVKDSDNDRMFWVEDKGKGRRESIATYHDHRMAMAFAPFALVSGGIGIENPEVVSKSYPTFWNDLEDIGFEIIAE